MPFDVFPEDQRAAGAYMAGRPGWGPGLDPTFGEAFEASWQAAATTMRSIRVGRNRYYAVQDWLDEFEERAGYAPPNPEITDTDAERERLYAEMAKAWEGEGKRTPGFDLRRPPSLDEVRAAALDEERRIAGEAAAVGRRPQTFGSLAGSVLGDIAGFTVDPVNLSSMAVGYGFSGGIVATALREAALAGGAQFAISVASSPVSREIDPSHGAGDVLAETGMAAAGGAILGGSIRGLASLWTRVRTGEWPRYVQDAGNVVEREAGIAEANPHRGAGADGEAAHRTNYRAAEDAMIAGRPLLLPDDFSVNGWRSSRIYSSDGRAVGVRYEVVEADTLIASHGDDMRPNPAYPPDLQPRDRSRALSSEQVAGIAARLEPERLGPSPDAATGSPIVGPDGIVESGNGRLLALRRAYAAGGAPADSYRNMLSALGFDPGAMRAPVLVARRVTDLAPEDRVAFATAANRATALRLSAAEQAMADARLIDGGLLDTLAGGDARGFSRGFLSRLPRAEQGGLVDKSGRLSAEGHKRIEAALLARAYGDAPLLARVLEDADSNVRALGGALTDVAGAWAALRDAVTAGRVAPGMDVTDDLLAAFRLVQRARDEGRKLADLIDQGEMFGGPSPIARALLGLMFRGDDLARPASRQAVARGLAGYVDEALKNTTDARLFGEPLGDLDVLNTALARAGREDLALAAEEATAPALLAAKADQPEVGNAVLHEIEHRLAADPDLAVPVTQTGADGAEITVMRPVRELLAEADVEIAAAREIEACAIGEAA